MATKPITRKERHTEHGAPMSRSHVPRTVGQRPRYDWRGDVRVASGLNVLAGVWLIISAAVLNYRADNPLWNDYLFGGAIALLAGVSRGRRVPAVVDEPAEPVDRCMAVWLRLLALRKQRGDREQHLPRDDGCHAGDMERLGHRRATRDGAHHREPRRGSSLTAGAGRWRPPPPAAPSSAWGRRPRPFSALRSADETLKSAASSPR
jgi:hypothetical protein